MTVRLFVGNLAYDVTEAELREHFAAVGPLASLALPMDRDTGKPRGFAFVEYHARADAEEAIRRLHQQMLKGRALAVSEARAREERVSTGTRHPAAGPARPAVSRPLPTPDTSASNSRNFGPDAAPRRRRAPAKGPSRLERGPKRPMYKRTSGPGRFNIQDDDMEEEVRDSQSASRRTDAGDRHVL